MDYRKIMYEQLARDFSARAEDFQGAGNLFVRKNYSDGRRIYRSDRCLLKLLSVDGTGVIASESDALLGWMKANSDGYAAWFSEVENLVRIDARLHEYGHHLADAHHYCIPDRHADSLVLTEVCDVRWFERDELEQFRGDRRFDQSLAWSETTPDMLLIVGYDKDGEIIGSAGASADSPTMWQVGVKTEFAVRGKGIGSYLIWRLKNEVLRRGFMPFYGTAESHIESQKVAYRSGFIPAWWEAYSAEN